MKLILAGPFSGKTYHHNKGVGFDPEQSEEYKAFMHGDSREESWAVYDRVLKDAINDPKHKVVLGHFGRDAYFLGKEAGRDVRLVVTDPFTLMKRVDEWNNRPEDEAEGNVPETSRTGAALFQMSDMTHWLNLEGKWENVKLFDSIGAALQ